MTLPAILIVLLLNVLGIDNRALPVYYETESPMVDQNTVTETDTVENSDEKVISTAFDDNEYEIKRNDVKDEKKPCAIVVLSNIQNPTMQSLLRRYRYDANGVLIPGSVKYFIKLPQGLKSQAVLVPLNDKAFSPSGGFVRYYKEVPPIPHAW